MNHELKLIIVCSFITVAVVVAFFICWAPFHAQRLVYTYFAGREQPSALTLRIFDVTTYISGILYHLSTCINPLLYNVMSNKFRQAFKVIEQHRYGNMFLHTQLVSISIQINNNN